MDTKHVVGYLEQLASEAQGEQRTSLQEMVLHISQLDSNVTWLKHRHLTLLLAIDKQTTLQARCNWDGKWALEPRG